MVSLIEFFLFSAFCFQLLTPGPVGFMKLQSLKQLQFFAFFMCLYLLFVNFGILRCKNHLRMKTTKCHAILSLFYKNVPSYILFSL